MSYSSINLEYYETITESIAEDHNTFGHQFTEALATGLQAIVTMAIALAYIWPLIIAALFYLGYRNRRLLKVRS